LRVFLSSSEPSILLTASREILGVSFILQLPPKKSVVGELCTHAEQHRTRFD
jgi:hypothetical protein